MKHTLASAPNPVAVPRAGRRSLGPLQFARVYREHHAFVWRTLRRLGVPEAEVEDALQDVFTTLHRRLPDFEGRSQLKTWIYGVVRRIASNYRRSAFRRQRRADAVQAVAACFPSTSRHNDADTKRQLLRRFLAELDDARRDVFVMVEIEGCSGPEVAQTLGIPTNTAYSRLRAVRRSFRAFLAENEDLPAEELIAHAKDERPPASERRHSWGMLSLSLFGQKPLLATWLAGTATLGVQIAAPATVLTLGVGGGLALASPLSAPPRPAATKLVAQTLQSPPPKAHAASVSKPTPNPRSELAPEPKDEPPPPPQAPKRQKPRLKTLKPQQDDLGPQKLFRLVREKLKDDQPYAALRFLGDLQRLPLDDHEHRKVQYLRASAYCRTGEMARARAIVQRWAPEEALERRLKELQHSCETSDAPER